MSYAILSAPYEKYYMIQRNNVCVFVLIYSYIYVFVYTVIYFIY